MQGTLEVTNCTIFNNGALRGSGIYNTGNIFVRNSTIGGNALGGSSSFGFDHAGGTARVRSTIIAGNGGDGAGRGKDVSGTFVSEGYNFIGSGTASSGFGGTGSFDQVGTAAVPADPRFIQFGDRGGPTPTLGIASDSPALDRGISGGINFDQRGLPRPLDHPAIANASGGDGTDIGAYEAGLPQTGPTYTVTTLADRRDTPATTPAPCTTDDCTLREALEETNANGDSNTIEFALAVRGTIPAPTDAFRITNPVTIKGPGARRLGLSGLFARRILVSTSPSVVISGLTFEGGVAPAPIRFGGAIYNTGRLTLNDCAIRNSTAASGGGIWNESTGTLTLYGCTLSGNSSPDEGEGGALNNRGITSAVNSTFSGNNSFRGGAINDSGFDLTMVNCTFTNNTARLRGGALEVSAGAVAANTIFAGNTAPSAPDIQGTFTSEGHNFVGKKDDGSTGFTDGTNGDRVGTVASPRDPLLGPLRNNGGQTDTHALLAGSLGHRCWR